MRWQDRLVWGWHSPLGTLFVLVATALLSLLILYLFWNYQKKKQDPLLFAHPQYYAKLIELLKERKLRLASSIPYYSLFGREWKVLSSEGFWHYLCAPPPSLLNREISNRWNRFCQWMTHHPHALFPKVSSLCTEEIWFFISGQEIFSDGSLPITAEEYLLDHKLSISKTEQILLEIARGLAHLHEKSLDRGEKMYHGYLLPETLLFAFDETEEVSHWQIRFLGVPFALGGEKMYSLLNQVQKNYHCPLSGQKRKRLLSFLDHLAPEQREKGGNLQLSPAVDFFSFGALAYFLFTGHPFTESKQKQLSESRIPSKWHSFLNSCLEREPQKRPRSFFQLLDLLCDTELSSMRESSVWSNKNVKNDLFSPTLEEIASLLHREKGQKEEKEAHYLRGEEAFHKRQWKRAKNHLEPLVKEKRDEAKILLYMAVISYKLGEKEKSKIYYDQLKQLSPGLCRQFHRQVVFRS